MNQTFVHFGKACAEDPDHADELTLNLALSGLSRENESRPQRKAEALRQALAHEGRQAITGFEVSALRESLRRVGEADLGLGVHSV